MSQDIITLGIAVESAGVALATQRLDALGRSAEGVARSLGAGGTAPERLAERWGESTARYSLRAASGFADCAASAGKLEASLASVQTRMTNSGAETALRNNTRQIQESIDKWRELHTAAAEPFDGAESALNQYVSQATNQTVQVGNAFSGLFSGIDAGLQDVWRRILAGGRVSLDSFRSLFGDFLSDLMHMAVSRPISISLAASMTGALGMGTAYANHGIGDISGLNTLGGASGLGSLGDLGSLPLSNMLPDSFTSGLSGILSSPLPGTGTVLAGPTQSGAALLSAGSLTYGQGLLAGTLGSLGYSMLGGALGLPQNSYSGLASGLGGTLGAWGGSALGSSAALAGSVAGSALPVVGTVLGAIGGGLLSSAIGGLFGKSGRGDPFLKGDMFLDFTDPAAYLADNYDWKELYGYDRGKSSKYSILDQGHYTAASIGHRSGAWDSKPASDAQVELMSAVADSAMTQVRSYLDLLPDALSSGFTDYLSGNPLHITSTIKDMSEEGFEKAAEKMQAQIDAYMLQGFQTLDVTDYLDRFDIDQSSLNGMNRFLSALAVVDETLKATEELRNPTSEWVKQAEAAVAQMDAWAKAMQSTGVTTEYATELMNDYRAATVEGFLESIGQAITPVAQLVSQTEAQIEQVEGWIAALTILEATQAQLAEAEQARAAVQQSLVAAMNGYVASATQVRSVTAAIQSDFDALRDSMVLAGNSAADLARLEVTRAQALNEAVASLTTSLYDDLTGRVLGLTGGDTAGHALSLTHRGQLQSAGSTFGEDSPEFAALQAVQEAERLQHEYSRLAETMNALGSAAAQAAKATESARLALVRHLVDAEQTARNGIQTAVDAWVSAAHSAHDTATNAYVSALQKDIDAHASLAEKLRQMRQSLWTDTSLVSGQTAYGSAQSQMDRLYAAAMGGDKDAASELAGVAKAFLDASYATQNEYSAYQKDFDAVQALLAGLEDAASATATEGQAELDALLAQNDSLSKANRTLAELREEMARAADDLARASEEQRDAYATWGFEAIVPGLAGLEAAYYDAVGLWISADAALNDALLSGLTTQSEIAALRITDKLEQLRQALAEATAEQTTATTHMAQSMASLADVEAARLVAEKAAQDALEKVSQQSGVYGSQYASEYELLLAKATAMNAGQTLNATQTAGGWTTATVKQAILEDSMSVADWYERYGKLEGFASGGLATRGLALVGEDGPELVDFSQRAMVFPHDVTRRLLDSPAAGTDKAPAAQQAVVKELREQNASLRAVVRQLADVIKNTKRAADDTESLLSESMRAEANTAVPSVPQKTEWAR